MKIHTRHNLEPVKFSEIENKINKLSYDLNIDCTDLLVKTINFVKDGVSTYDIDEYSANIAEEMALIHKDFGVLATRIIVSNIHKSTPNTFSECMELHKQVFNDNKYYKYIMSNSAELNNIIDNSRDNNYTYFGLKTLQNSKYLWTLDGKLTDRPQYLLLRVAIQVADWSTGCPAINEIKENYDSMIYYTHATPTLFHACIDRNLNSCFLIGTEDDTASIMETLKDAALISKDAGGIGSSMTVIRSNGSPIKNSGSSTGVVPQLCIHNTTMKCFDQQRKRAGAHAVYFESWHGDIQQILSQKLATGSITNTAPDLFYGLWNSDLFMKRYKEKKDFTLFSTYFAPELRHIFDGMEICTGCGISRNPDYNKHVFGKDKFRDVMSAWSANNDKCEQHIYVERDVFTAIYEFYENQHAEGLIKAEKMKYNDIMDYITHSQRETGTPYMLYKDSVNRQSNHSYLGTLENSNLCAEITQYCNSKEYATCTLASINLPMFVKVDTDGVTVFDFDNLKKIVGRIVRNLDNVVTNTRYPVEKCVPYAHKYRPIGIGIQGLSDVFMMFDYPFISAEAEALDMKIIQTIYMSALDMSADLALERGAYAGFENSKLARGELRMDSWRKEQVRRGNIIDEQYVAAADNLRAKVMKQGVRNSLMIALMPTATTSQILGNNESFEPIHSNIYSKDTNSGKFTIINKHLQKKLGDRWNSDIINHIIQNKGSVSGYAGLTDYEKEVYKTVWEMSPLKIIKRAALRGMYVDQSQSLNIHMTDATDSKLRGVMYTGWQLGITTGSYYIRSQPASNAMKVPKSEMMNSLSATDGATCYIGCESCSS